MNFDHHIAHGQTEQGLGREFAVNSLGHTIVTGDTHDTGMVIVPGIVPSAAYAAGDAVGKAFAIVVPKEGFIETICVRDLDAETIQFDIVLFNEPITSGTDNSAYDMADLDADKYVGHVTVTNADFVSFNDNSVAIVPNIGLMYHAPKGVLYAQIVTRGAPTYGAAQDLALRLIITKYS